MNKLRKIANFGWNSPTITTWASYVAQMLSLFLVLPLVLRNFDKGETAVWFLFSSFISLQSLADFGFKNTFSRSISFAMGGVDEIKIINSEHKHAGGKKINWKLIKEIISTARVIYIGLSLLTLVLMSVLGTLLLIKPFSSLNNKTSAYISWGIVILVSSVRFYGNIYLSYLEGTYKIPLLKRWEALTFLGSVVTSFLVLIFGGRLLGLVISNQIWVVIGVIRNKFLCNYVFDGRFKNFSERKFNKTIFNSIWPAAWRSGVAGIMNFGVVNLSGLLYAQIGTIEKVGSYLLSIRILNAIRGFSMAPFYSKLPLLARLRAEGNTELLIKKSIGGMRLAHFVFLVSVILIGTTSNYLLKLIGSQTEFVPMFLWVLLSSAYFIQRYGAMHMQLYLTTHHVIAHIADSVSGMIFIIVSFLLINKIDLYAFPIGMLVGYLGFYAWYSAKYSLKSINMKFWDFEKKASLPVVFLSFFFAIIIFLLGR